MTDKEGGDKIMAPQERAGLLGIWDEMMQKGREAVIRMPIGNNGLSVNQTGDVSSMPPEPTEVKEAQQ